MSDVLRHVHILSTGDVIASSGREVTITKQMLESMAKSYDQNIHRAPLVLGHTSDNEGIHYEVVSIVSELLGFDAPTDVEFSLGWVLRAYVDGNDLYFDIRPTDLLVKLMDGGYYQRWSISFYGKQDDVNPVKGEYYIQHLAFLGATPPAFKGLEQIALSEKTKMTTNTTINMDTKAEKYLKALLFAKNPSLENSFVQFSEAPTESNAWLFNKEANAYQGSYTDSEDQLFDFEVKQDANQKWEVSYNLAEAGVVEETAGDKEQLSEATETDEVIESVLDQNTEESGLFGTQIITNAEKGLVELAQKSEFKKFKKEDEEDEDEKKKKDKQKTEMSEEKDDEEDKDKKDKQKTEMSEDKAEDMKDKQKTEMSEDSEEEDEEEKKKKKKDKEFNEKEGYPEDKKEQMSEGNELGGLQQQLQQMQEMLTAEQDKNKMLVERMGTMRRDLASQFAEHCYGTYGIDESVVSRDEFTQLAETFKSRETVQLSEGEASDPTFDLFKKVITGLLSLKKAPVVNLSEEVHKVNLSEPKEEKKQPVRKNVPVGTEGFSERSTQLGEMVNAKRKAHPDMEYEKALKLVLAEM